MHLGVGFPQMNEFNIVVFTFWLFVEDLNPGVYNLGSFCNLGVFSQVDFLRQLVAHM